MDSTLCLSGFSLGTLAFLSAVGCSISGTSVRVETYFRVMAQFSINVSKQIF